MQINFYCEEKGEGRVERLVADVFIIDNFLDYQKELVLYKFFLLYPTYISFSSTIPQISISWQVCFAQLQRKPFKDTKNWRRRYCLGKEWTKRNPSEFLFFFCWHPSLLIQKITLFEFSLAIFHSIFFPRISALRGFSPFIFLSLFLFFFLLYSPDSLWVWSCLGEPSPSKASLWSIVGKLQEFLEKMDCALHL